VSKLKRLNALPHRPVYQMHRYFARRPFSVFSALIKRFSREGDLILDPFCGGGVTLVEGLIQKRKVVGYDINPIATFVTRKQLEDVDLQKLEEIAGEVINEYNSKCSDLFATICRKCKHKVPVLWFENTSLCECKHCGDRKPISLLKKVGIGTWECGKCKNAFKFSVIKDTPFKIDQICYECVKCGTHITKPMTSDYKHSKLIEKKLISDQKKGLWLPNTAIPDCNMQRESALFKKKILFFRDFFSSRQLLGLGRLKKIIMTKPLYLREWLLFIFSSTLRYSNRMVTFNPAWRGNRPLEWSKPGFWMPPVFLESNVMVEFERRLRAVIKGKRDLYKQTGNLKTIEVPIQDILKTEKEGSYHVHCGSSTDISIGLEKIDLILTDPPYGSYVHYADLCNFWAVWFPELRMGKCIENSEEAVIARKRFPGAKNANDYQKLLEKCFSECARVLKKSGHFVLTFNNREPKAWFSLLIAARKAGFNIIENGIMYADGINTYKHTSQSRRKGSLHGDFILIFKQEKAKAFSKRKVKNITTKQALGKIERILKTNKQGLDSNDLFREFYTKNIREFVRTIDIAIQGGDESLNELLSDSSEVGIFDSHRQKTLLDKFNYKNGKWSYRN